MSDYSPVAGDVDIAGNGLCFKRITQAGHGTATPQTEDKVRVHYTGRLLDGTVFDSSVSRGEPFEFTIGKGMVIKGWDAGVATMHKGEKAILTCLPSYAYGERAMGKIPANSTLAFEVELLSWRSESHLTEDGGVQKVIITHGAGWQFPKPGWKLLLSISTTDGENSERAFGTVGTAAAPFEYVLGSDAHRGLEVALPKMKLNERARVVCAADYRPASFAAVPAGVNLVAYEIEVLAWRRREDLSPAQDGSMIVYFHDDSKSYEKPSEGAAITMAITLRRAGAPEPIALPPTTSFTVGSGLETVPLVLDLLAPGLALDATAELELAAGAMAPLYAGPEALTAVIKLTALERERGVTKTSEVAELVATATRRKDEGTRFFGRGIFERARAKYRAAIDALLKRSDDLTDEHRTTLLLPCYLNVAACALKLSEYRDAVTAATAALAIAPTNVKGLFRRADANMKLENCGEAIEDCQALLAIEPENAAAKQLLGAATKKIASQKNREKAVYSKMFG